MSEAYCYQCAKCCTTLYADPLPDHEDYYYVITGELCSSCQMEEDSDDDD